jgi:hypothetical protein
MEFELYEADDASPIDYRKIATELAQMVTELQWQHHEYPSGSGDFVLLCRQCDQPPAATHSPDCPIGGLLERPEVQALLAEREGE